MSRIPIKAAKDLAKKYGFSQICLIAYTKETGLAHVVTYGKTLKDCEQAAILGNCIKLEILRWPKEICQAVPARVLRAEKKRQEKAPKVFFLNEMHTTHTTKAQARREREAARKKEE